MHLLLVEDDRTTSDYLRQGLADAGYAVDAAFDGDSALAWASTTDFDLMVLDIMLPGRDGFSVCRALRDRHDHTPILMLTARDAVDDRIRGLDAGADDYLVKPFSIKELEARIRALLRRTSNQGAQTTLRVGDLSLNENTRTVRRGEVEIALTAKELAVLESLMRERGQVLSRDQIANHVWGFDTPTESNIIDVYIRNLRRKIDDGSEAKLIQTVKGLGYRIRDKP